MPNRVTAFQFQRQFGSTFQRVRGGETLIITYDGVDTAAILPMSEYKRLETPMSEDLTEQLEQMQREDLAGYLAFNAYNQAHADKAEAIRALAEAILKVQALP